MGTICIPSIRDRKDMVRYLKTDYFAGETTVYRLRWEWVKVPEEALAPA